jgi:predicted ATPase/class 3 adenylate cyclase
MECLKCHFQNREGIKFCEKCGTKMELTCPNCGVKLPLDRQFCGECGRAIKEPKEAPSVNYSEPQSYTPKHLADKILTTRSSIEGERKLVTVLFADVANYTSISEKLDPEEVHQIMDGCFKILMDEIHKYEGTINQFTGDGVMALFGAPVSHEDHAQRGCYAALSIQKAMADYGAKIENDTGVDFKMRIGLNSGQVIVGAIGDDLRMDYTAVGQTTNLAARMESIAKPGAVMVTGDTHKLTRDYFEFESQGQVEVKGKEEPQDAFQLLRAGDVETRFAASVAKGLTKFVGRKNSIASLMEAYEKVRAGSGQVVGIVGEAGVGKSRLLLEFKSHIEDDFTYLEGRCLQFASSMVFLPLLDILRSYCGLEEGEREFLVQKKLKEKITAVDGNLPGTLAPFQDLLSLKVDDEAWLNLEPKQKREKTFEALRDLLIRESQDKLLVLTIEDLHWMDKSTEAFLDYFIDWLAGARVLLLVLYRPEYNHQWGSKTYYNRIGLDQLTINSSAELVQAVLGQGEIVPELRELILGRAAGNPLFMEELTSTLLENGSIEKQDNRFVLSRKPSDIQIPDTIQGIIAARMDRLEDNLKRTMQVASVIGRDFAFRILQSITDMREGLKSHLLNLQGMEFIYEKNLFPELEYIFKHALTQEVAYNSLLHKRRKEIHRNIGEAIEQIYAEKIEGFYEMLAYHFDLGEVWSKAIEYLVKAGQRAIERSANIEAISHLNKGIDLLGKLPSTEKRKLQELDLQMSLGTPLMLTKGFAAPEVESTFSRALELCEQVGETPKRFSALWGVAYFYGVRSPGAKPELGEQLFQLAQSEGDQAQRLVAHRGLGAELVLQAKFTEALELLQQGLALYDREQHRSLAYVYGQDIGVVCQQWTAWVLWILGYPDQALNMSREAALLARETSHPMTEVYAAVFTAMFHRFRREAEPARKLADKAANEAADQGFGLFLASANVLRGSLLTEESMDDGIALMQQGLTGWRATGAELFVPFYLALLAEAYGEAGRAAEGLAALDEALTIADKGGKDGERLWDAELSRIKGELLLGSSHAVQAEACFQEALQIARTQRAKSWELRASVSLSLLWKNQGRRKEARELLQGIYDWFTEGFDTPDLINAKALLGELY